MFLRDCHYDGSVCVLYVCWNHWILPSLECPLLSINFYILFFFQTTGPIWSKLGRNILWLVYVFFDFQKYMYSTAQRENAKSTSFQGLSQRGINEKSVCIRGQSAKQHGHDGQNVMSSWGHHGLELLKCRLIMNTTRDCTCNRLFFIITMLGNLNAHWNLFVQLIIWYRFFFSGMAYILFIGYMSTNLVLHTYYLIPTFRLVYIGVFFFSRVDNRLYFYLCMGVSIFI